MNQSLLFEMCLHCNNWFNVGNVRPSSSAYLDTSTIDPAFITLSETIAEYIDGLDMDNVTSSNVADTAESKDLDFMSWQTAFKNQLSLYRRARFL